MVEVIQGKVIEIKKETIVIKDEYGDEYKFELRGDGWYEVNDLWTYWSMEYDQTKNIVTFTEVPEKKTQWGSQVGTA